MRFLWTNSTHTQLRDGGNGMGANQYAAIKALGVDVLHSYLLGDHWTGQKSSDADTLAALDACQAAGLKLLLNMEGLTRLKSQNRSGGLLSTGEITALTTYAAQWKDHPALWGWYTDDEGTASQMSVAARQQVYTALKGVSAHPVFEVLGYTSFTTGAYSASGCHDWVCVDWYTHIYDTWTSAPNAASATPGYGCQSTTTGNVTNAAREKQAYEYTLATVGQMAMWTATEANRFYLLQGFSEPPGAFAMPPTIAQNPTVGGNAWTGRNGIEAQWAAAQAANMADHFGLFLWHSDPATANLQGIGMGGHDEHIAAVATICESLAPTGYIDFPVSGSAELIPYADFPVVTKPTLRPSGALGGGISGICYPKGRSAFLPAFTAPPTWSSREVGGYSEATCEIARPGSYVRERLLGAPLTLIGRLGPCFYGIVNEVEPDGTLHLIGPMPQLGFTRMPDSWTPSSSADLYTHIQPANRLKLPLSLQGTGTFIGANHLALNTAIQPAPHRMLADYFNELLPYTTWKFGFYWKRVNGAWSLELVYQPAPTAFDYIVTLSDEDAQQFLGDSLESMSSAVGMTWGAGNTFNVTADADATHYLVQIGLEKTEMVSAPNTLSALDAALIAAASLGKKYKTKAGKTAHKPLTKAGKRKLKAVQATAKAHQKARAKSLRASILSKADLDDGSPTTRSTIQLASGLPAYPANVIPGRLAMVIGPDFADIYPVVSTDHNGDTSVALELGRNAGNLSSLLAGVQ